MIFRVADFEWCSGGVPDTHMKPCSIDSSRPALSGSVFKFKYIYIYMGQFFFYQTTLQPKAVVERFFDNLKVFRSFFFQIDTGIVWEARRAASNELG